MRKINEPIIDCIVVFDDIVNGKKNILSKLSRDTAINNSNEYKTKAENAKLCSLPEKIDEDLKNLYCTLSNRKVYNTIKDYAPNQRCLYCLEGEVVDLDHFIPKSKYSQYAISPINLIPVCRKCNSHKSAHAPKLPSEQILHPYFDKNIFFEEQWLYATIKEGKTPIANYYVKDDQGWVQQDINRAKKHFELLKIGDRFRISASEYISEIQHNMKKQPSNESRKKILSEEYESLKSIKVNSLKTALYLALSESDWYCSEGYKLKG